MVKFKKGNDWKTIVNGKEVFLFEYEPDVVDLGESVRYVGADPRLNGKSGEFTMIHDNDPENGTGDFFPGIDIGGQQFFADLCDLKVL